jgi:hypothetical protein
VSPAKIFCGLIVCTLSALSSISTASVYSGKIRPMEFNPRPDDYSRGLDASLIHPIESANGIKYADVQKMIPTDLDPNNQSSVGQRIFDTSLKSAIDSDVFRKSSVGQTATNVEKSMQANISVSSREPNSIKHEFKLAADPMQAQARINYSGVTNAQLSYHATESKMDFEWREPVAMISTDVVYNHVNTPSDRKDLMSLRWSW